MGNTLGEPTEVDWKSAALRVGEALASAGPTGYYDFSPERWRDWALSILSPSPIVDTAIVEELQRLNRLIGHVIDGMVWNKECDDQLRKRVTALERLMPSVPAA